MYERTVTGWAKKGSSLAMVTQERFGNVVEINEDATVVAIANQYNTGKTGKVMSYDFVGTDWVVRMSGSTQFYHEHWTYGDNLGASISLTADGKRIAIGIPRATETEAHGRGLVKIFDWNTDVVPPRWDQLETSGGGYLAFEDGTFNGEPVSISDGGNVLVVGSRFQNSTNGRVRTFVWNEVDETWYQAGPDLHGLEDAYFSNAVHITGSAGALPVTYGGPRLTSTPPADGDGGLSPGPSPGQFLAYIDSRGAEKSFNFSRYVKTTDGYTPATLHYSFSINNHALLSVQASDATTGAVTLKTKSAIGEAKLKVRVTTVEAKADVTVLEFVVDITAVQDDADPVLTTAIPDVLGERTLNLTEYFTDIDGDLAFEVDVADTSVATGTIMGSFLSIEEGIPSGPSTTLVTVTARDAGGASASDNFTVTFVYDAGKYLVVLGTDGLDDFSAGLGFFEVTITGITKSDYCPGGVCTDDIIPLSAITGYTSDVEAANDIANVFNGLTEGSGSSPKWTLTVKTATEKSLFYLKVPTSFTLPASGCGFFYYIYHANWEHMQYYLPSNARLVLSNTLPGDVNDASAWTGSSCDMTIQHGFWTG